MADVTFRLATPKDAERVLLIYAPFVENSHVSFEYVTPSAQDVAERIRNTLIQDPWIIAEINDELIGYAYANTFRKRTAYSWTREVSIYMSESSKGSGIAQILYKHLWQLLKYQGYRELIAGIALPNDRSIRFHEKMGFTYVGTFHDIGLKKGKFHGVGFWQMSIGAEGSPGEKPIPIAEVDKNIVDQILGKTS